MIPIYRKETGKWVEKMLDRLDGTERGRKDRRDRRSYMVGVMRNKYRQRARRRMEAEWARAEARRRAAMIPSEETTVEEDEDVAQEEVSGVRTRRMFKSCIIITRRGVEHHP